MPRSSQANEKRKEMLPIVARAFAELGYRRATTAELAGRCGVRENILYRLWSSKKAMFIASIDFVFDQADDIWRGVLTKGGEGSDSAILLLAHEAEHYGESGLHRIIFAGLSELDDPDIRDAMRKMYSRFHQFVRGQIRSHRGGRKGGPPGEATAAWAIVGLGNVANIGRELGLVSGRERRSLFADAGRLMLDGRPG